MFPESVLCLPWRPVALTRWWEVGLGGRSPRHLQSHGDASPEVLVVSGRAWVLSLAYSPPLAGARHRSRKLAAGKALGASSAHCTPSLMVPTFPQLSPSPGHAEPTGGSGWSLWLMEQPGPQPTQTRAGGRPYRRPHPSSARMHGPSAKPFHPGPPGPPGKWEDSHRTPRAGKSTHSSTWRQLLLSFVKATARCRP